MPESCVAAALYLDLRSIFRGVIGLPTGNAICKGTSTEERVFPRIGTVQIDARLLYETERVVSVRPPQRGPRATRRRLAAFRRPRRRIKRGGKKGATFEKCSGALNRSILQTPCTSGKTPKPP